MLAFAAGETEQTAPVLHDAHGEGSETLTLSKASGARVAYATATGPNVDLHGE